MSNSVELGTPLKLFAGIVTGVSVSLVVFPILFLIWFVPLGRPGHRPPTPEESLAAVKAANAPAQGEVNPAPEKTEKELQVLAQSSNEFSVMMGRLFLRPLEYLLISGAAICAAYCAARYARANDMGEGKPDGSVWKPTVMGSAVGVAAMWIGINALLVYPQSAYPHGESGTHAAVDHSKSGAHLATDDHGKKDDHAKAADHGNKDEHAAAPAEKHAAGIGPWLAENHNIAELIAYFFGTIVASLVACLVPRGPLPQDFGLALAAAH